MATTFVDYTGDGNATKSFSFPSYQVEDVKVEVDGVVKTVTTDYTITGYSTTGGGNVVFTSAPASPANIRIYRETDIETAAGEYEPKATYQAGSSVKANDLNNNQKQALYAIAEQRDQTITTQDIKDNAVTMDKLSSGALPTDITVTSDNIVDLTVDTADIKDDAVSVAKIADAELTTLAAMQQATALKLADTTALTSDIADLNQIDGLTKQSGTGLTNVDTSFPTSAAVVNYVTTQIDEIGGFEAIADEVSFPNTQPGAGVAISIADAAGIVVDSSGSSTTGTTVGGSTVTINNIPSNFHSSTVATGVRFIVTSTGSGQIYNYHKATLAESDLVGLSGQINDFQERYRVGSTNPTTNNDNGDLFYNTSSNKLLVYDGSISDFKETQAIGNFSIETLSPAFDGTTQDFTISSAPSQGAQQMLLSINGVVQKPNSGTSTPSQGFAVSGSTVKLSAAPPTGSTYFAVVMGSSVGIGTPSDNTVTTAILQNLSVSTGKIQDEAITLAKLEHGTSSNDGKFLRANNGADPTFETVDSSSLQFPDGSTGLTLSTQDEIQVNSANYKVVFDTDTGDTHHISFAGPSSLSKTSDYTLPEDGTNGQFLKTDGSGVLSFATVDLTNLSATNLTSGTIPDARFPATLPVADGSNLTGLDSTTANGCIYENNKTITSDFTTSTTKNSMSAGPITVDTGVTLTVPSGSFYTII